MRLFQVILLFVLSIAIPLQGVAGLLPPKAFCPTEYSRIKADSGHACCNQAGGAVKSGKVCGAEQNCQSFSVAMLDIHDQNPPFAGIGVFADFPWQIPISFEPFPAWRPPDFA